MRYLHTMIRVSDLEESLNFFKLLDIHEVSRKENEQARFTLVFLSATGDEKLVENAKSPLIELTFNWDEKDYDGGRNFGHLAFEVDDIYTVCKRLLQNKIIINRPPRDGRMAFVQSPDQISIELLQKGKRLPIISPWKEMPNQGTW
ncbi:MAG: lactoylglutathione lyase [SAR86 cluster bacterium]|uniref:Lactoylglutathione lyase n=1 Tax=SAR86 cluster bacterium TaxID=2030880 RepID=A0A368BXF2_9GAMM|nr:MAG: lactoylglutathione lyase [SAR86 cluster bacterium]